MYLITPSLSTNKSIKQSVCQILDKMGKIIHLLKDPIEIEKMGNKGKRFVYETFSIQKHISDVSNAIKNALKF